MTRINTVQPRDLLDEWLIAEYRELPRIPNNIINGKSKLDLARIPKYYVLGKGHVKFHENKLLYLCRRHNMICEEMDWRGFYRDPSVRVDLSCLPDSLAAILLKDWEPTRESFDLNIERLQERFDLRKRAYHLTTYEGVRHNVNCEQSFNEYLKNHLLKYYS